MLTFLRIIHLTSLFILGFITSLNGQLDPPFGLTFNSATQSFESAGLKTVPFDEPFEFKISDKSISSVQTKYRIVDHCNTPRSTRDCRKELKNWKHYRLKDSKSGFVTLPNSSSSLGNFRIAMDPLHPNERYEIFFTMKKLISIDHEKSEELSKSIADIYDSKLGFEVKILSDPVIDDLVQSIEKKIRDITKATEIYDQNDKLIDIRNYLAYDEKVKLSANKIIDGNGIIRKALEGLLGTKNSENIVGKLLKLCHDNKDELSKSIKNILTKSEFKEFREKKVNTVVDEKATMQQVLTLILHDFQYGKFNVNINDDFTSRLSQSYLEDILSGKAKINGSIAVSHPGIHLPSVKLLFSLFTYLSILEESEGILMFKDSSYIKEINDGLKSWLTEVAKIESSKLGIREAKQAFPNILYDKFLKVRTGDLIISDVIIDSKESPYFGLDFGVLIAPNISSTFTYEGINFHWLPVNRKAKYSHLEGWDEFFKRLSLNIGIAQRIGNYDDSFKKKLSVGSPFLGVGFRANRLIRLNVGALFYDVKSENPTEIDPIPKTTYGISASLDIKLKNLFSSFGI